MRAKFHPEAETEMIEAAAYYGNQSRFRRRRNPGPLQISPSQAAVLMGTRIGARVARAFGFRPEAGH